MKLRFAVLAALSLASATAFAATFQELDRNADGFLSKNELSPGYESALREADDNRDGRLDADEFFKAEAIHEREQAGKYVGDSVLTAKVKTALLRERGIKSTDVHVESRQGRVLLSGFVDTEEQKERAVNVASRVEGVREVRDGLNIR